MEMETLVQTEVIARMLGVSSKHVTRLSKPPHALPVAKPGKGRTGNLYDLHEVHVWDLSRRSGTSDTLETRQAEELRKITAEATRVEIQNEVELGTLVYANDVAEMLMTAGSLLRAELRGLPGRLAVELASETNAAVVQRAIKAELDRVLNNYAEALSRSAGKTQDMADQVMKKGE